MKPIQILVIIFCLGIFLIPKDNFYAQASQENCCKKESNINSCCEKDHSDHNSKESKKDHKSCNDDCCSFCMTCHTFVENHLAKDSFWQISSFEIILKIQVQYSAPYLSNGLKEIWQPPKLG